MPEQTFHAQGVEQICKLAESRISMAGFVGMVYPVNPSNDGTATTNMPVARPTPGASAAKQIFYFELCNLLDGYQWSFVRSFGLDIYDREGATIDRELCCEGCRDRSYYYNCCCSRSSWVVDLSKLPKYPSYFIEALVCQLAYRLAQGHGSFTTINATLNEKNRALSRARVADAKSCPNNVIYYGHYCHAY